MSVSCQRTALVFRKLLNTAMREDFYVAEKLVTSHGTHGKLQVICDKVLAFII